ncbi:division/cell wall cluster transcriptional repressor MraZ [Limnochorda pilosa]|uniref:Transcriptional regulator MraZ n=1 Tax=Limnochorda pilosa TaxID=1555112 RepID=A0A0K2SKU7_LIMPI|nr:division/cell wall cluster transcriptional repressor MraZ [Limnochorda pilosa]BAS27715.1 cell division protein MraZ [Limnochorda pilosa]
MFLGEYEHSLDEKGRLTVPSRFREDLAGRLVVTRGLDHCLFLYPYSEWQVLEQKLKSLPMTQRDARAFVRLLFSGASEQDLDRQGRLLLPANLREYAAIDRDVVIIGVSNRVELWSKERWNAYEAEASQAYEDLAEKIVDLGI